MIRPTIRLLVSASGRGNKGGGIISNLFNAFNVNQRNSSDLERDIDSKDDGVDQELIDTYKILMSTQTYYHMNYNAIKEDLGKENDDIFQSMNLGGYKMAEGDVADGNNVGGDIQHFQTHLNQLYKIPFTKQLEAIDRVLEYQVQKIFQHVWESGGLNSYPPPPPITNTSGLSPFTYYNDQDAKLKRSLMIKEENKQGSTVDHPLGSFKLQIRKSDINHEESGYGVHVHGYIHPGTVLAVYPGDTHISTDIDTTVVKDNDYLMSRYDGTIIDSRSWLKKVDMSVYKLKYFEKTGTRLNNNNNNNNNTDNNNPNPNTNNTNNNNDNINQFRNQFAIGQFINHPPKDIQPNVIGFRYNFTHSFPKHLQQFIPHHSISNDKFLRDKSILQKSFIIVASRPIQDEELLLNYRYNPKNQPYPAWYTQPDLMEAIRRWRITDKFSLRSAFHKLTNN